MELECSDIVWISALAELCINPQDYGSDATDVLTELCQSPLDVRMFKFLILFQDSLSLPYK